MAQETFISSFDGTQLFLRTDMPAAPRAIIIIVHGLCEHSGRYDYVTNKLTAASFGVYRFDHRGHGRSQGVPIFYRDFNEMIDDVNVVVELVRREHPTLPIFLLGHSMGGFAVTTYGMKYPTSVNGIVTSGAVTRFNRAFPIPPDMPVDAYFPNELADGVCSDPAVVEAYVNDPLVAKQISFGLFYALFAGVEWNKQNSYRFVVPALILHGCHDGLVSEKDSRDFFGDIASQDKTLKIYAFLFHEIFNEPSKDEVIGDVIAWLEKRV
ncbi:MAG TPA: alpha/beta hydrolase [Chloroflexi bacterium]|nr:alpha/beta hydrolase [Chloroflexota bacterium]